MPDRSTCPVPHTDFTAERLDLDPRYAELRKNTPVTRVTMPYGGDAWLVTRYEDVKTVLADPRFSRAAAAGRDIARSLPLPDQQNASLLSLDPPEHSRLRRLVAGAFTVRRVRSRRESIQRVVDELLDRMAENGSTGDLVSALAWPLPLTVICDVLGIPLDDQDKFREWIEQSVALSAHDPEIIKAADDALDAYLTRMIAERRREGRDDLLGELVLARDEGDRLSEEELVTFGVNLLIAGQETTAGEIGNFVYTLLSRRERWEALVADPALVPAAVEELLRLTPLEASVGGLGFTRIATEDVELGGRTIRAGDAVVAQNASANRDESVFDHPDELDFSRADASHVTFGHGPHHCLGAPLARLELQVVLETLIRRLPGLRLAVPADDVVWTENRAVRGPRELPVTW
ncbi:cytochrome P450 [Streptomyces sp. NPDC057376]|uniref:cytochrome P450 n=1 Tax=unclassified Streptomyces TaxID=2593676 RepID=UPI00093FB602|nr:cytochrome P450 [Streptomyces sp. CB02414]OKI81353.1 cytochrome [Streptomyces sp. CB02414]